MVGGCDIYESIRPAMYAPYRMLVPVSGRDEAHQMMFLARGCMRPTVRYRGHSTDSHNHQKELDSICVLLRSPTAANPGKVPRTPRFVYARWCTPQFADTAVPKERSQDEAGYKRSNGSNQHRGQERTYDSPCKAAVAGLRGGGLDEGECGDHSGDDEADDVVDDRGTY